ncbi:MAG: tRNA (guanine-N(1)-)-methyltransferase [Rhodocyclaceae bacterium]|nr:tRNA (guanine-N(1)-)-methyltransferase [Rhodocyclaceae bacterium]
MQGETATGGEGMRFDVVSLFPAMFAAVTEHGVSGRAFERGLCSLHAWNPREFASDPHRTVDDRPYGGGPGMVMMAEPLAQALSAIRIAQQRACGAPGPVILLSPQGRPLRDARVRALAAERMLTLVCGRYEGVDQRLIDACVDEEVSVGDFVLSGGELAAMSVIDAVVRLLPGALGDSESAQQESFAEGLLDCPHYTRPEIWRGVAVPEVLLSGHHERIRAWRASESMRLTRARRPDLLTAMVMDRTADELTS